ncbi:hypothetical protein FSP39_020160, partial [Pinctada imbricata]
PPIHDVIKPVAWLIGKWKGDGEGKYPTMDDFTYREEIEFFHFGKPMLQFNAYSTDMEGKPLHREIGFLRIKKGTSHVALIVAHNNGVSDMEEGEVNGQEIKLESHTLGRMTFGAPPQTKKLCRTIKLEGDTLSQVLHMETENTSLTEHLRATYKKVT